MVPTFAPKPCGRIAEEKEAERPTRLAASFGGVAACGEGIVCTMAGWSGVGEAEGVFVSEGAVSRAELVSLSPESCSSLSLSKLQSRPGPSLSVAVPLANKSPAVSARLAMSGIEIDNFRLLRKLSGGGLASSSTSVWGFSSCCLSAFLLSISMYTVDSRGVTSGVSSDPASPLRELDDRSEIIDKFRGILRATRWVVGGFVRMLCR